MGIVLVLTGLITATLGAWRGYAAARGAIGPLIHDGEPTRTALDGARPLHARVRVQLFARRATIAVGWLAIALYGLFLVAVGMATP